MAKCVACGKSTLLTSEFGNITICKTCATKINLSVWKNRDSGSVDELIAHKSNALQLASEGQFSDQAMQAIADYFDAYIDAGYITTLNGKAGQLLKVFKDFCIIDTKNENKKIELSNMFYQFDHDDDDDDDESFLLKEKATIVKGLMSGKLLQTGIGLAASAVVDNQAKEKASEKKSRERHRRLEHIITVGETRLNLKDFYKVETYSAPNTANGYLRLVPKGATSRDTYECSYFFFNNSIPFESKKIKQRVDSMRDMLNNRINEMTRMAEQEAVEAQKAREAEAARAAQEAYEARLAKEAEAVKTPKKDKFEEIRMYKALFDEGIITEDEFNMKKKELLGL